MKRFLTIRKAYWLRFWHCMHLTLRISSTEDNHQMVTGYYRWGFYKSTIEVSCSCGKCYYRDKEVKEMF